MSDMGLLEARLTESFAPPTLRLQSNDPELRVERSMGLLWLDIVGFTRITSHFLERGPDGTEELATLLEHHFNQLIDTIIAHGGEPLMFAGDALLAGWPCSASDPGDAVVRAAACVLQILATPGAPLPLGERIALHAVLAFGSCQTAEIGTNDLRLHVTIGSGLADLQATSTRGAEGECLVSVAARGMLGDRANLRLADPDLAVLVSLNDAPEPRQLLLQPLRDAARARIAAHVPLPIASRLNRSLLDWTAELRRVTVVFVSLPGIDHAAPDTLHRLEAVIAAVHPKVLQSDGFIQQLRVDESGAILMVVFGIPPVAHPDDPVRAVRCAIHVRDALRAIGQRSSIGIATGRAFCGVIGNDTFRTWTTYGEAVNLAARLVGLQQGAIQCDEATVRGTRNAVLFTPLGRSQVRGMGLNVPVWTPGRQDRAEVGEVMEGRAHEVAHVLDILQDTAQSGQARLVFIEAESGMGKSRLLAELRQKAIAAGATVLFGAADQIERSVPYRGWRGVLADMLGLDLKDRDAACEAALNALGPEFAAHAALLNAVLQVDLPETAEVQAMAPPQRLESRLALLLALLRRAAHGRTMLLTIDDAQWLDEESWALVTRAMREVPGFCLVMAMQPLDDDRRIEQLVAAGARRLVLGGLSDEEQDRLALTRLGAERMSPELATLLRGRARGHPYFCVELALALHDEGLIEVIDGTCHIARHVSPDRLPLPDTVHAAVTRRIDRLDLESQVTLKVASAAGLRFPTKLVVDVHPTAGAGQALVDRHLSTHHRAGMLRPEHVDEQAGYTFAHAIMRDVAYELMLYGQRRQLHRAIATWYEQRDPSALPRSYAVIAHHLEAAGEPVRASQYLLLEAERVFHLGLVRQSVTIGLQGARLLGANFPTDGDGLQQAIGREMEQIGKLLGQRSPEDLVNLPPLQDEQVASLIPLLLSIAPYAYQSQQPELFALLAASCLRLTLAKGQSPFAPDVYAMYSVVYAAMTGDRPGGAAWSRLSLKLQPETKGASFARCAFIHVWFHNHWSATLEEGIALAEAGADAGLADGEITYGCFNLTARGVLLAAAGRSIAEIISTGEAAMARIAKRVRNTEFTLMLELQSARALAGTTPAFDSLSDAAIDEEAEFAAMREAQFSNQVACYYTAKLRLAALGGDWRGALAWAERAGELLPFFAGQPAEVVLVYYGGAAALCLAAFGASSDAETLRSRGWDDAERLRSWEALNPSWLGPRADLLEALLEAGAGRHARAQQLLRAVSERTAVSGQLEDRAFALECLARVQVAAGQTPDALPEALAACAQWGADGKRTRLAHEFGAG